jgi:hypothetical protein
VYDVSSKFNTFYKKHVILPRKERQKLFDKKNLNLDRLITGLDEYNLENKTNYVMVDSVVQGSVAMSTVTQNEENDYDIDVAVIFDMDNIPDGTTKVKNIIVNALRKKCKQFNVEPEAKTNCVRIVYSDGYHIDFAIYRRYKDENDEYKYEHCGSDWRARDPRAITKWFIEQNKEKDHKLRTVVRLLKMFCKSRSDWKMPGGLIQSVLANEQFQSYNRIDEMFYYTLSAVRDRLIDDKEVNNPTDENQDLKLIKTDETKMNNLYNRLTTYLAKLNILFTDECNQKQALEAWNNFFNHSYWNDQVENIAESASFSINKSFAREMDESDYQYKETEEFIEYMFPIENKYQLSIDCKITQNGFRPAFLREFLRKSYWLSINKTLDFYIQTNTPKPYDIYWKVKNKGIIAKQKDCVRGQIVKTNSPNHQEYTSFKGEHFVECYIVRNGVCVAKDRIIVPIST